jgi:phytoene dehydrogenase-like protein
MALVPVGHLHQDTPQDMVVLVKKSRSTVFERLSEIGIPDLKENIKFKIVYSPKTWQNLYNLTHGAAFGLSHDFWQVEYLRSKNRHQLYHYLYFVGASTHPCTGLPIVLIFAKLTSEHVFNNAQSFSSGGSIYDRSNEWL